VEAVGHARREAAGGGGEEARGCPAAQGRLSGGLPAGDEPGQLGAVSSG
jgi:hypothetical protein